MRSTTSRTRTTVLIGITLSVLLFNPRKSHAGAGPEDDLQVVKRALHDKPQPPPAREEARPVPAERESKHPAAGGPQWLRVRIDKRDGKKVRVTLPLGLVRAVGDWPLEIGCQHDGERRRCSKIRLSEVLATLDRGQSLVEIEDDGNSVRVWIE